MKLISNFLGHLPNTHQRVHTHTPRLQRCSGCDFASRDVTGHKSTKGQEKQLGRPCSLSQRERSPILPPHPFVHLFPSPSPTFLFPPSLHSPMLSYATQPISLCALHVPSLHLFSTPAVSPLAAHWDHMAAEVRRLSQWSVTHRRPYHRRLRRSSLNNSLRCLFPIHS